MKAREVKRAKLVARYAEKREALKKIIATSNDPAEAYEAARKLQAIPKNANPIRLHNRCKITGRPKGYIRQFGISRIQFREMASAGLDRGRPRRHAGPARLSRSGLRVARRGPGRRDGRDDQVRPGCHPCLRREPSYPGYRDLRRRHGRYRRGASGGPADRRCRLGR